MQNDDKTTKRQNNKMSAKESTSFLIEAWALDSGSPAESASLFSLDNGGTGVCCRQSAGSLQHRRSDGLSGSRLAVRQASAPARCCLHHPRDDQHWPGQHLQSQAGPIGRRPDSVRTRVEARAMCSGLFLLGKQLSRIRDHLQPEIDQIHHPEIF